MTKKIWIGSIAGAVVVIVALVLVFSHHSTTSKLIRMAHDGATETEMLAVVEKSPPERPSTAQLIELKDAGVPNTVVITLLHKK